VAAAVLRRVLVNTQCLPNTHTRNTRRVVIMIEKLLLSLVQLDRCDVCKAIVARVCWLAHMLPRSKEALSCVSW
jgi:hypothetical protein